MTISTALAFLPIGLLLLLSLTWGVRQAIFVAFAAAAALFFVGPSPTPVFFAGLVNAAAGTLTILMIVGGALLLYAVMQQTGALDELKASLDTIHPDRDVRFVFLALFLTAFFESVAGFGTPGVVVPLLLIGMGFSAPLSIAAVLLFNGLFAVSGAVGTPVTVGLETPLALEPQTVARIYTYAAVGVALAAVPVMLLVRRQLAHETGHPAPRVAWALLAVAMLAYAGPAPFLQELTGIAAAATLLLFAFALVFTHRRLPWRPWLPYAVLVALLLLPKLIPPLADLLAVPLTWPHVFGTDLSATLQPLRSPLVPFLAAAAVALLQARLDHARPLRFDARPVLAKAAAVALILFPSLAITQLMLHGELPAPGSPEIEATEVAATVATSGGLTMVEHTSSVFVQLGPAYPLLAPVLAVLGTFMTGSTTVSNLIFAPVQQDAATILDLDTPLILALQLTGASLGNAVCLFNIIAAAAVVGLKTYTPILRRTLPATALATATLAAAAVIALALRLT